MIRRIFRYVILGIVGILLALVLVPIVFKDKIIALVKKEVNQSLNARVDFEDADISLLRSFPKASIRLEKFTITGIDSFENIALIDAGYLDIHTNLTPIFNSKASPVIHFLKVKDAQINVLVLEGGSANYDITKPSGDTSSFELDMDGFELENAKLNYTDQSLQLMVDMQNLNLTGSGSLSSDVYDLKMDGESEKMTLSYEGVDYIDQAKVGLDAGININFPEEKYTLLDNKISINELDGIGEGFVQFVESGILFDFNLKTGEEPFKNYLSALPFLPYDKNLKAGGQANFAMTVNGVYNGETGMYPAISVKSKVSDGFFQYPEVPYPVESIQASIGVEASSGDWSDLFIDIPSFSLSVNKESIGGNLMVKNALSSGSVAGKLKGSMNLAHWKDALPSDDFEKLSGIILADFEFAGSTVAISNQDFEKIRFDGKLQASELTMKMANKPVVAVKSGTIGASPALLKMETSGLELGQSRLNLDGSVENPLAVFLSGKAVKGKIIMTGDLLDLNEWQSAPTENAEPQEAGSLPNLENLSASNVVVHLDLKKVIFGDMVLTDLRTDSEIGLNHAHINSFYVNHDGNDISLEGNVANIYAYLFGEGILDGVLVLKSKNFDANKYMAGTDQSEQTSSTILIPEKVNLKVDASIDALEYSNFQLKNSRGTMHIANKEMILSDVKTGVFDGEVALSGFYRTQEKEPDYSVKLDLSQLNINQLFNQTVTMKALAPVGKFLSGYLNTTLVMEGKLQEDMTPVFPSLNASGFIETFSSQFSDLKIIDILADKLGMPEIKKLNLDNTKNWFEVKQGYVELKERLVSVGTIEGKISGKHQISGPMEYVLFLKIPRALMEKNKTTATIEKGWSWVENEASKRGLNLAQGEFIDFRVDIGGKLAQPQVKIVPLGSSGKSLKEEISDEVKEEMNQLVDSVKTVINEKKDEVLDTVSNKANEELDKLKDKVKDQVDNKTDEILNQTTDIIKKQAGSAIDSTLGAGATDSLAKKAEAIIRDKTGGNVDDIMKKLDDYNPFKKKKN